MEQFIAGQLACLPEFTYLLAPNINSYKRFVRGSFAPTAVAWGLDNRTCSLRVVGHGQSLRVENRVPGGDVNPYLAVAAIIAAGLHGIENELPLEPRSRATPTTPTRRTCRPRCARRPPLYGLEDRPQGVRRRDGRPLPQRGAGRARRVRRRRHRLGADPWLRTPLSPTAADRHHHLPRAGDWGVWSRPAAILPRVYLDAVAAAGGIPLLLPPTATDPGCSTSLTACAGRRRGRRPGALRRAAASSDGRHQASAGPPREAALSRPRSTGTCRCSASAADADAQRALGGTLHQHLPEVSGTTSTGRRRCLRHDRASDLARTA